MIDSSVQSQETNWQINFCEFWVALILLGKNLMIWLISWAKSCVCTIIIGSIATTPCSQQTETSSSRPFPMLDEAPAGFTMFTCIIWYMLRILFHLVLACWTRSPLRASDPSLEPWWSCSMARDQQKTCNHAPVPPFFSSSEWQIWYYKPSLQNHTPRSCHTNPDGQMAQ